MSELSSIHLKKIDNLNKVAITLPASKSISNRALILNALADSLSNITNLSEARDTQTMIRLLNSSNKELDVIDAGTTMRFLTAYFAITGQQKILTGSQRMQERPIKLLVDTLRVLGADISYLKNEGYPPLSIIGFHYSGVKTISIPGNISSQYISAMMMIAPLLPNGLTIHLAGSVGSKPYIEMTASLMKQFGAIISFQANEIHIQSEGYKGCMIKVEPDWSAASYWFGFVALSDESEIHLKGLTEESLQGDSRIVQIMKPLGVDTSFSTDGALLRNTNNLSHMEYDFTDCPDLAQTVLVVCAIKGISGVFKGLESLKIKETDRVYALQNELAKFGVELLESNGIWYLKPSNGFNGDKHIEVETYDDHRMAMAFALVATKTDIIIKNPSVVNKSYPRFWTDLKSAGLTYHEVY